MKPAAHWFEARELSNDITRIRERHLDPATACNIWHIRGRDRDILMDTGTGLLSLKQAFPVLARRPVICIVSHAHFDHCGGAREFDDRRIHGDEAKILTRPDRDNTTVEGYLHQDLFFALPFAGFEPDRYQVRPAPPTDYLAGGDTIDLGGRLLEVLHLPGHSPGSIGLYEPATGILFSGDTVYDGRLFDDTYHSDIPAYRNSMQRLLDLPVSRVYGGHFDSFDGTRLQVLVRAWLEKKKGDSQ